LRTAVLPASALGKARRHTRNQSVKLTRLLEHPELELSNHRAENAMGPVAVAAKTRQKHIRKPNLYRKPRIDLI
jgi:hypothetical protein